MEKEAEKETGKEAEKETGTATGKETGTAAGAPTAVQHGRARLTASEPVAERRAVVTP